MESYFAERYSTIYNQQMDYSKIDETTFILLLSHSGERCKELIIKPLFWWINKNVETHLIQFPANAASIFDLLDAVEKR